MWSVDDMFLSANIKNWFLKLNFDLFIMSFNLTTFLAQSPASGATQDFLALILFVGFMKRISGLIWEPQDLSQLFADDVVLVSVFSPGAGWSQTRVEQLGRESEVMILSWEKVKCSLLVGGQGVLGCLETWVELFRSLVLEWWHGAEGDEHDLLAQLC